MARPYTLKRRGERQEQTRQRIVEAAVALHQERGIAATTMADIAERANVGRVTVYRHFPDEMALVQACSGRYVERHPFPDPAPWRAFGEPLQRFRAGLAEVYAYHRETEPMMARVLAEARDHPVMQPYHDRWRLLADVLAEPWPVPQEGVAPLKAALALALDFATWHLLVRERGLSDGEAIGLMAKLPCACLGRDG